NPFEVLRLDPAASEEEVVRQGARLRQRAADEAELNAVRQAVQALTGSAEERALHALRTHPRPEYAWPALAPFAAAFRRPPPARARGCPPLALAAFAQLLRSAVAAELEFKPLPFAALDAPEDADEVQRQTAEALWQALLCDPRA